MKDKIILKDICGEFCTTRNNQGMDLLKKQLTKAIEQKQILNFDRAGIKILGISFIDELFCQIMTDNNIKDINLIAKFTPPLEEIYIERINRGIKLRKNI